MEKLIKIVFLVLFCIILIPSHSSAAEVPASIDSDADWKPVVDAIIYVESRGNSNAKCGASVGVLQITPVLVAECNNILRGRKSKKRFKLSDRYNVKKSIEMFLLIQSKYNPKNDIERAIRSWNGGIHYSVKRTQRYFEKVMNALHNL